MAQTFIAPIEVDSSQAEDQRDVASRARNAFRASVIVLALAVLFVGYDIYLASQKPYN